MEQNNVKSSTAAAKGIVSDAGVEEYLKSFPGGVRFVPKDEELVDHYLMKKINNETLPPNLIREANLYSKEPTQLTEEYEPITETEWYFFTPRYRKYPKALTPARATPNGYWKASTRTEPIPHGSNHPVANKTTLDFYAGRHPQGKKTAWRMQEFVAKEKNNETQDDTRLDDWVLCKVFQNRNSKVFQNKNKTVKEKPTTATQPATVNVAENKEAQAPLMVENNNGFEDQNRNASQPTAPNLGPMHEDLNWNVSQPAPYQGPMHEYQNWNVYQPIANVSGNNGASLMVGNNNLAFEDQNWKVSQPTLYQVPMLGDQIWNVSQPTLHQGPMLVDQNWNVPYQGPMHEYQNWNVSQPTPYQGPMHEYQNWNVSQPPYQGPMHADQNWSVSYQRPMHEYQNWNVSQQAQPTSYQGQMHEDQNWNVSQPTPNQGPMHAEPRTFRPYYTLSPSDQNQASFWDCGFDTFHDQSSGKGM